MLLASIPLLRSAGRASAEAAEQAVPDFTLVYRQQFAFVFRAVRRLGVPDEALDDAVQEVFLIVHRKLDGFDARSSLKTWLFGIVLNVVRRRRRTLARRGHQDPLPELRADAGLDPHELLQKREAGRFLYRFLQSLDDAKREVFVLCEIEQLAAPEVAVLVGAPVPTVYSRLQAARAAFESAAARQRARDGK